MLLFPYLYSIGSSSSVSLFLLPLMLSWISNLDHVSSFGVLTGSLMINQQQQRSNDRHSSHQLLSRRPSPASASSLLSQLTSRRLHHHQHQKRHQYPRSRPFLLRTSANSDSQGQQSESPPDPATAATDGGSSGNEHVKEEAYSSSPSSSSSSNNDQNTNVAVDQDLLQRLDTAFQYDGRMQSSKGAANNESSNNDSENNNDDDEPFRCGFVSILGAANMGKSTLMNALLEEDLCITTARPQTTRHAILGILSTTNTQVCLVDTPGILAHPPAYKLQEGMMEAVMTSFRDADILVVVTDLFSTPIPDDELFQKVQLQTIHDGPNKKPVIVCINKIDLVDKVKDVEDKASVTVEQAVANWRHLLPDAVAILPIAATNGATDPGIVVLRQMLTRQPRGIDVTIRDQLLGQTGPVTGMFINDAKYLTDDQAHALVDLPISPPLYDQESFTDRTERFVASEIIRSALFETLKKELPYCCEVRVESFKDKSPTIIRIGASILVERDSQKQIVIGRGGDQIKRIGTRARHQLEQFFQTKVFVQLYVKVDKNWRKREDRLKEYGYLT